MLKKTKTWVLIMGSVLLAPVFASGADVPIKGPSAFLPTSIHEFAPALEGASVKHEFILYNRGDEPLEILKIESG